MCKRMILTVLAVSTLFVFAACGNSDTGNNLTNDMRSVTDGARSNWTTDNGIVNDGTGNGVTGGANTR